MKLVKVNSTNIEQVGYEEGERISFSQKPISILRVIFTSGITYDFYNVPRDIYEGLIDAHSVGKYFHQNIKNRFEYERK